MTTYYRVNFEATSNADLRQAFSLADSDGAPIDLTSASMQMDIEDRLGGDILTVSSVNGRLKFTDAVNGQFELIITAADLAGLTPGNYGHDMIMTLANSQVHRVWTGTFNLVRGVTE